MAELVARTILGSAGTSIVLNGLDGDTDVDYEILGHLEVNAPTTYYMYWRPNGAGTDTHTRRIDQYGSGGTGTSGVIAYRLNPPDGPEGWILRGKIGAGDFDIEGSVEETAVDGELRVRHESQRTRAVRTAGRGFARGRVE